MLTKILRKRTRVELEAWQTVRDLMPRNRKTKGNQFEVLEYLFECLYEKVSEEELSKYLLKVKGHLQRTGDPVKGAINQAIKELQRLPNRPFELIKIQEAGLSGPRRFVQLNFTSFEEVIGFDLYLDYLQDIFNNEREIVVRGVNHLPRGVSGFIFPGLNIEDLVHFQTQFLINHDAKPAVNEQIEIRFVPKSIANIRFLLVYENKTKPEPFLGFLANSDLTQNRNGEFILYRGAKQQSKLLFLHRLWRDISSKALTGDELVEVKQQAQAFAEAVGGLEADWQSTILHGLVARRCEKRSPL